MGTQQSRSVHSVHLRRKDKRSTYSDTEGRRSGEGASGHRYTSAHQPQKQAVDREKSKTSETGWASSATQLAPANAAPPSDLSQPEPHGLAGNHATTEGTASGDGPEGRGDADRIGPLLYVPPCSSPSSTIRLLLSASPFTFS
ncbi:hypothetical protein BD310DRAFT_940590 [Dichomitus squalens]|uniref:Uncharacterized protein n=1 Tax=Dichomitus squalens TaxID=114155 RepID=A0A4Q9PGF1_9APHY|nr:hypothetical protein BD310DRAFT_940590 [Dichomitus squalens]